MLRTMTGPSLRRGCGQGGFRQAPGELARSNLFVVPLDEQGEWYRYHHLFSDLLLYELEQQARAGAYPERRASVWLEDEGFRGGDPARHRGHGL